MKAAPQTFREAAILARLVGSDESAMSASAAKGILRLTLSPADREEMHVLAAKARAGTLSKDEQADVEAYSRISSLLGILKSKARCALERDGR